MSLGPAVRRCAALVVAMVTASTPAAAHAQEVVDVEAPVVSFSPCETFQKDRPFVVTARFADQSALFEPKLVFHTAGEKIWKHAKFTQDGELWRATVPKAELTGALEYFVEVFDENGNGPSRVGSPEAPLFARAVKHAPECPEPGVIVAPTLVEEHGTAATEMSATTEAPAKGFMARCDDEAPPLYCKRWVWAVAGGAVLATIGIIVLASSGGSDRGYPDRVTFVVQPQGLESPAR